MELAFSDRKDEVNRVLPHPLTVDDLPEFMQVYYEDWDVIYTLLGARSEEEKWRMLTNNLFRRNIRTTPLGYGVGDLKREKEAFLRAYGRGPTPKHSSKSKIEPNEEFLPLGLLLTDLPDGMHAVAHYKGLNEDRWRVLGGSRSPQATRGTRGQALRAVAEERMASYPPTDPPPPKGLVSLEQAERAFGMHSGVPGADAARHTLRQEWATIGQFRRDDGWLALSECFHRAWVPMRMEKAGKSQYKKAKRDVAELLQGLRITFY